MSTNPSQDPTGWEQAEAVEQEETQNVPLFIVATGQHVGKIGTAEDLAGETVLQEGQAYDPEQYPDLARFLAPFYGQNHVPSLSKPAWL